MEKDKFNEIMLNAWTKNKFFFDQIIFITSICFIMSLIFSLILKTGAKSIITNMLFYSSFFSFVCVIILILLTTKLDAELIANVIKPRNSSEEIELRLSKMDNYAVSVFLFGLSSFSCYIINLLI